MPTKLRRISIVADDALAAAIDRVRPLFPDRPTAWIVRRLALEGAASLREREQMRSAALERLVAARSGRDELQ